MTQNSLPRVERNQQFYWMSLIYNAETDNSQNTTITTNEETRSRFENNPKLDTAVRFKKRPKFLAITVRTTNFVLEYISPLRAITLLRMVE